jgi:7-cyano-7-deazaguanine synthase
MPHTVILASGGINSTVAAVRARKGGAVHLLHADYGQPAATAQRLAVESIAEAIGAGFTRTAFPHVVEFAKLRKSAGGSVIATGDISKAGLQHASQVPGLMSILLAAAVHLAQRLGANAVHVGASELADEIETDSAPGQGTPDHRREFYYLQGVMYEQLQRTKTPVAIETPLIDLSRADILKLGTRYETPFDLTYSCHRGQTSPCGDCPGCQARTRAFEAAGLLDPAREAAS